MPELGPITQAGGSGMCFLEPTAGSDLGPGFPGLFVAIRRWTASAHVSGAEGAARGAEGSGENELRVLLPEQAGGLSVPAAGCLLRNPGGGPGPGEELRSG